MSCAAAPIAAPQDFVDSMNSTSGSRNVWLLAFSQRTVWLRAAKVGLPVGCLQAVINQGDVWWQGEATSLTLAKTVISPLITFSVALIAAAGTWVEKQRAVRIGSGLTRSALAPDTEILSTN